MRILIIEDDERLAGLIARSVREQGHEAVVAYDGTLGLRSALDAAHELIVMDLMLPGMNGIELCRALRRERPDVPIIMLTALGATDDKVEGFDAGADDYLVKPFDLRELHVRIRALAKRRSGGTSEGLLRIADLELDSRTHEVRRAGEPVHLTPREFNLLAYLLKHAGRVVPRTEIAREVWGIDFDTGTNFIDVYINYLRRKMDRDHGVKLIHTKPGVGFMLREGPPA
jgi:DNA-binding response OmpR family regulator